MQLVYLKEQCVEPKGTTKVLERITEGIAKCKKAVLLIGAGCSTSAGIPDFRSKDVGLYSTSSSSPAASTSTLKGPAMFSSSVYSSPETTAQHLEFLTAFKDSLESITSNPPTPTHGFMTTLKKHGKLRRVYTQNIDDLEGKAGLRPVEIEGVKLHNSGRESGKVDVKGKGKAKLEGDYVQLHGSIHRVRCSACDYVAEWTDSVEEDQLEGVGQVFRGGEVASCPQCSNRAAIRALHGKRSLPSRSFLRPAITLYGENSPAALSIGSLSVSDLTLGGGPDLMLVMGTSLKIPGFRKLVKEFGKAVKAKGGLRILVNREEIKGQEWKDVFDYHFVTDSDLFTKRVVTDWKRTRPRDWVKPQSTLFDSFSVNKKQQISSSKPKSDPTPRPPLRTLSSNTILPPLPSSTNMQKSFKIVSNNPWSTVEYSDRPSKRAKVTPSPSPSKPLTTRTSQAALTPLSMPDLSFSPFSSPSSDDDTTTTPPQPQPHHRVDYLGLSPLTARCPRFDSISPTKPCSSSSSSSASNDHLLFQPFKPPLVRHSLSHSSHSKPVTIPRDSRTPSPLPFFPSSPEY
ncbi:uncharacterized protein JCM6883_003911 [Sporobolomyces salmoneus]|uniref:uncharacterized protein n=1 Tax=Sporobolomyces salmoneus TaxID=183962 RepID=UPI00317C4952